jgi:hypothetical protein
MANPADDLPSIGKKFHGFATEHAVAVIVLTALFLLICLDRGFRSVSLKIG